MLTPSFLEMSLIGLRHGKDGIRRSKTVCDVRPDISTTERNGRTKKKNIFSKMLRSLSKLSKRNKQTTSNHEKAESAVLSSSGHGSSGTDSVLNESKNVEFENVCGLPGTSFGDNSAHTHGSDSASTGYVSEGSSRRMTSSLNNINATVKPTSNIDLERENKLAKRAHAARFRSETDFVRQAVATTQNRRQAALDTDLDRDETDLETDEDRESDLQTEETDEPSDSFYTSDCSSTSYVTDEDSGGGGGATPNARYNQREISRSNSVLDSYRQRAAPLRHMASTSSHHRTKNPPVTRKLPSISRTMSAREFNTLGASDSLKWRSTPDEPVIAPPTAPSPALKARIMRLTLGEQIDTNSDSNDENKKSKADEHNSHSSASPMMRSKSQVKEIASKFLNTEIKHNDDQLHRPVDLKRTQSTNINSYKSRPTVLEKFAPKVRLNHYDTTTNVVCLVGTGKPTRSHRCDKTRRHPSHTINQNSGSRRKLVSTNRRNQTGRGGKTKTGQSSPKKTANTLPNVQNVFAKSDSTTPIKR